MVQAVAMSFVELNRRIVSHGNKRSQILNRPQKKSGAVVWHLGISGALKWFLPGL
jgi:hypothetical protein